MRRSPRSAFTVIESAVGLLLTCLVTGAIVMAQRSTSGLFSSTASQGQLEERAQRALGRLAGELRWAGAAELSVSQALGCARLEFRTPAGLDGAAVAWEDPILYRVEPSTVDGDGNGMLDELRLVRDQAGASERLCDGIAPAGFKVQSAGGTLQVSLRLHRRDSGSKALASVHAHASVSPRN
jgi:hypothetical protein